MTNYSHNNFRNTQNLATTTVDVLAVNANMTKPHILSLDTLNSLQELGGVLRGIRKRMITEGYELINGIIRKKI